MECGLQTSTVPTDQGDLGRARILSYMGIKGCWTAGLAVAQLSFWQDRVKLLHQHEAAFDFWVLITKGTAGLKARREEPG